MPYFSWQGKVLWRKYSMNGPWLVRWLHRGSQPLYMHYKTVCCRFRTRILIHSRSRCLTRRKFSSRLCLHFSYWGMFQNGTIIIVLHFGLLNLTWNAINWSHEPCFQSLCFCFLLTVNNKHAKHLHIFLTIQKFPCKTMWVLRPLEIICGSYGWPIFGTNIWLGLPVVSKNILNFCWVLAKFHLYPLSLP